MTDLIPFLQNVLATTVDSITMGNTDFANDGLGVQNLDTKDNRGYSDYTKHTSKEKLDPQAKIDRDGGIKPSGVTGIPLGQPFELTLASGKKRDYIVVTHATILRLLRNSRRNRRNTEAIQNSRISALERGRRR